MSSRFAVEMTYVSRSQASGFTNETTNSTCKSNHYTL